MADAHDACDAHIGGGGAGDHRRLMGWGEPLAGGTSTGTTGQIELAHEALDRLDVTPGPLALRVLELTGRLSRNATARSLLGRLVDAHRNLPAPATRRALREDAGLAQQDIASALGVHRETVSRWESGDRVPRGELLIAYAEVLGRLVAAGVDTERSFVLPCGS